MVGQLLGELLFRKGRTTTTRGIPQSLVSLDGCVPSCWAKGPREGRGSQSYRELSLA